MDNPVSKIFDCQATQCVYNKNKQCHTPAITIGDTEPCCDTFFQVKNKGGFPDTLGTVGACKISGCEYNDSFECTASGVHIVMNVDHPDCGTYKPRQT